MIPLSNPLVNLGKPLLSEENFAEEIFVNSGFSCKFAKVCFLKYFVYCVSESWLSRKNLTGGSPEFSFSLKSKMLAYVDVPEHSNF